MERWDKVGRPAQAESRSQSARRCGVEVPERRREREVRAGARERREVSTAPLRQRDSLSSSACRQASGGPGPQWIRAAARVRRTRAGQQRATHCHTLHHRQLRHRTNNYTRLQVRRAAAQHTRQNMEPPENCLLSNNNSWSFPSSKSLKFADCSEFSQHT